MPEQQNTGLSAEQLNQILEAINSRSDERMLKFAQEIRKPSLEEQAKIDKDNAKLKERVAAAAKLAKAEEEGRKNAAKNCPHGTVHKGTKAFTHQWRAQIHMPYGEKPYFLPRCTQCGSTWADVYGLASPKILASPEQIGNPIDMDQWSMEDIRRVVQWALKNPVEEMVGV